MSSIKDDKGYNQGFTLHESTVIRMKRRASLFADEMQLKSTDDVLEIGCGTGEISYWIAQQGKGKVLGTDLCVPFIEDAAQKYKLPNLEYMVLDFNKPEKLEGRKFDYIIGNGILHHLYYTIDEVLEAFKRLLKPGGRIIFMEPNVYNPYCALIFNIPPLRKAAHLEPDEMAFSKSFISKKLSLHKFQNIKVSYRDFLLPGIPLALVKPSIAIGNVVEQIPVLKMVSQSIFIVASL
jgi:2-polyprenyl-3-methyl-5-hydroxy-6-metoxy-1,4-benzoquinol methylase